MMSIGFCTPKSKEIGVTIAITPISYPFELVAAASKQPPYEALLEGGPAFFVGAFTWRGS